MADDRVAAYCFHEIIQGAYTATLSWLNDKVDEDYTALGYRQVTRMLKDPTLLSAAAQIHTYFPTHFFKAIYAFEHIVTLPRLTEWLKHNPRICIVDIGCGAGAGSAAFIQTVLKLQETGQVENTVQVCCTGIDPNPNAIALYLTFLTELRSRLPLSQLDLAWTLRPQGIPSATSWIIQSLNQKRSDWNLPNLPHVIIMQVNVVSPLDEDYTDQQAKYETLANLGIEINDTADSHSQFGDEQALAYHSILEGVNTDHIHIITIGTRNYLLDKRVEEMGIALQKTFDSSFHQTISLGGEYQTRFHNPEGSRWFEKKDIVESKFYADVTSVTNRDWQMDTDWQEVVSPENLKLAWARARYELMKGSFTDEVEIRVFENNLDENLERMSCQLAAYAEDVARVDDYVAYKVPKNQVSTRPKGLSPIEEELLSVAIIQKLGQKESQLRLCSYAYRIVQKEQGRDTEYLYQYWLDAHEEFLRDAREEAKLLENGAVLRVDIKSYFTRIEQDRLIRLTTQALTRDRSQRVAWLIRLLLSRNLDEHELGHGIVQGNIGSGFYANIYLTDVDMLFGANNKWKVRLFRYVDDMILVIPESEDGRPIEVVVDEVMQALVDVLGSLELELNEKKTEVYYSTAEFIQNSEPDGLLKQIGNEHDSLINRLWILDSDARSLLIKCATDDDLWWHHIKSYCHCLKAIGYYAGPSLVSRWIHKYLFNSSRRRRDLGESTELTIEELPLETTDKAAQDWATGFISKNPNWVNEKEELRTKLSEMFLEAWSILNADTPILPAEQRKLETRLRFALFRLGNLGFGETLDTVLEMLVSSPWITKGPSSITESLAHQGYVEELLDVLVYYRSEDQEASQYLRAVLLRAMRFSPEIHDEHWDIITEYAIQGTLIEQLMATETWLLLRDTSGFVEQAKYTGTIREELTKNVPLRLTKNYMLLLSQYDALEESSTYNFGESPIVQQAFQIGRRQEALELLSYVEPSLIRANFYSGRRADEPDYRDIT